MVAGNRILSVAFAFVLFLAPAILRAQATGEILGTITDPSGAVVPNAKVTAIELGTNFTHSTVAGTSGTYFLPELAVGTYRVTVTAPGFKAATSIGIALNVNQQREVNFRLALGASSQLVEVHATPPLANVTNGSLGGLVSGQQVATLPLNGRDISNLILMQPGVNYEIQSYSGAINVAFVAANGNRGTTVSSYVDGVDTSDDEYGGGEFSNFNLDAIAEFKVLQNNYSAQWGRGSGAIVQIVTKSGTNALHGSAFDFLRNSAFDARNFFSSTVPPFRRNEFGATFGGPVVLPKIYNGKNRTFFFVEYAGERQRLGEPTFMAVPTPAERSGVVNITGANGQPDQLKVPLTPLAGSVLNKYPLPNDPTGPDGARTFVEDYSLPENADQGSIRIDHRFSDKDSVFGRFTDIHVLEPVTDPVAGIEGAGFSDQIGNFEKNLGVSYTHVFSPTLLNTFLFGYVRSNTFQAFATQAFTTSNFTDGSLSTWGPDTAIDNPTPETGELNDTLDWVKGRNSFNIGFVFERTRDTEAGGAEYGPAGTYFFEPGQSLPVAVPSVSGLNNLAAGSPSPSSLLSFMLGIPNFYGRTLSFPGFGPEGGGQTFGIRRNYYGAWVQDDIKASRKFTLNLGLRYEYNGLASEAGNRFVGIDTSPGDLFGRIVLNPTPPWSPDYTGFAPRLGFAYRLTPKTTVRGGWGMFTNLPLLQTPEQNAASFPFYSTAIATSPTYSVSPQPVFLPYITDLQGNVMPPHGNTKLIPPNTPINLVPLKSIFGSAGLESYLPDPNLKNGYTMSGNFTLERQLPGDSILQVSYVSNNAVRLYGSIYPNGWTGSPSQYTPYTNNDPGLGEISLTSNGAHSTYNALQVMARKVSAQHGITFQASYTWSKDLDNSSTTFNGPASNSAALPQSFLCYRCEKGPADFDFPQRFVLNFVYQLPFSQWQALSSMPRKLTHGWQMTSIISAQSGYPFTVNDSFPIQGLGEDTIYCGPCVTRPDLVQTPTMNTSGGPSFFSPAVIADGTNLTQKYFATPGALTTGLQSAPGSLGRNTFRTQPFSNWDFSLIKDTKLSERATLQFRAEFFNLLNQHAFLFPGAVLGSPGFGVASATALPERQIQFALRLMF